MSVELTVTSTNGTISFTGPGKEFLDVEAGRGMEPGDPKFTEKVWARSLLKQGATFALESLREKEMVFPLKLHASSKTALTNLIQEINTIITSPGSQVKWKDEGATEPTYFDLLSGQLDDEFDFRLGQNNWLKCRLRLFVQPLGYPVQSGAGISQRVSGVATTTKVGTAPLTVFAGASPVDGDGAALLNGFLLQQPQKTSYWGMSVLPTTAYTPLWPVGTAHVNNATFSATANAIGGTLASLESGPGTSELEWQAEPGNLAHAGLQRFLLVARCASPYGGLTFQLGELGVPIASTAIPTVGRDTNWNTYDLGAYPVPSMWVGSAEWRMKIHKAGASSPRVDVAGIMMLPDNTTAFVAPPALEITQVLEFDGMRNRIRANGQADMGLYTRGAIPPFPAAATAPPVVAFLNAPIGNALNATLAAELRVLPRTRYAF